MLGIQEIVRVLDELVPRGGPRFEPCAELRRRADGGQPFHAPERADQEGGR